MIIKNPSIFRENVSKQIYSILFGDLQEESVENEKKSSNVEKCIFNYSVQEATSKKIIRKWDNIQFVQIYTDRMRTILLNLKNNEEFKQKVITEKEYDYLTKITHQEICPKKWNELIIQKMKRDDSKFSQKIEAMTDIYTCRKCGSKRSTFYELQTRSADESMTIFIRCIDCGTQMKK